MGSWYVAYQLRDTIPGLSFRTRLFRSGNNLERTNFFYLRNRLHGTVQIRFRSMYYKGNPRQSWILDSMP